MNGGDMAQAWAPRMLSVLRIMSALLYIEHGSQKLLGFPASERGTAELFSIFGLGGVLELFGGILLLIGLFTRPVAFMLSGQMAVAYFMVARAAGVLPGQQWRRRGDPVLLRLPLFVHRRARPVERWTQGATGENCQSSADPKLCRDDPVDHAGVGLAAGGLHHLPGEPAGDLGVLLRPGRPGPGWRRSARRPASRSHPCRSPASGRAPRRSPPGRRRPRT